MADNISKGGRQKINIISAEEVQSRIQEQRELSRKKQEEKEAKAAALTEEVSTTKEEPEVVDTYEDFKDMERIIIQNPIIPGKKIETGFFGRFLKR